MKRISWREDKVFSMQTRKGLYVLGQMLKKPYVRFYNVFGNYSSVWNINTLEGINVLFTVAIVPKNVFDNSIITVLPEIVPDKNKIDCDSWIHPHHGFRTTIVYQGLPAESEILIFGSHIGGMLVKKDLWWTPSKKSPLRKGYAGICDEIIYDEIPTSLYADIDQYELTVLNMFPLLNERLYLSHLFGKSTDPLRDLIFDKHLPKEYEVSISWMASKEGNKVKEDIVNMYFK